MIFSIFTCLYGLYLSLVRVIFILPIFCHPFIFSITCPFSLLFPCVIISICEVRDPCDHLFPFFSPCPTCVTLYLSSPPSLSYPPYLFVLICDVIIYFWICVSFYPFPSFYAPWSPRDPSPSCASSLRNGNASSFSIFDAIQNLPEDLPPFSYINNIQVSLYQISITLLSDIAPQDFNQLTHFYILLHCLSILLYSLWV